MRTVYKIFTNAILVLLIVLAALLIVPRFLGITPMAVLSGSMEPTYHVGSMLYVKSETPENIKQGDPITFKINDNTMVTHRVIAIDSANQCFYTKGGLHG
jgi:signal peptidase